MMPRKIDYSDIPELSDRQLSATRRVGRPTVRDEPRKQIAIRLNARILRCLRKAGEIKGSPIDRSSTRSWPAR
jgi:uncharacterized protein (DUF4415 family)